MARSIVFVLGLVLPLSACVQIPVAADAVSAPVPVADAAVPAQCDAGKASLAISQLPTPEVQERARTRARAEVVRVLRRDQLITEEFNASRLNLGLDAEGRIASVNCG